MQSIIEMSQIIAAQHQIIAQLRAALDAANAQLKEIDENANSKKYPDSFQKNPSD